MARRVVLSTDAGRRRRTGATPVPDELTPDKTPPPVHVARRSKGLGLGEEYGRLRRLECPGGLPHLRAHGIDFHDERGKWENGRYRSADAVEVVDPAFRFLGPRS